MPEASRPAGVVRIVEEKGARVLEGFEGEPGEWVELGFKIGEMERARLEERHEFHDGRRSMILRLPNGEGMFICAIGGDWRGTVLPRAGGNGWDLRGEGANVVVREMLRSAMICASDREGEVAGLPPISVVAEAGPQAAEGMPELGESLAPLNSLPGATGVIYLDFDGETVSGTLWNSSKTAGAPIVAAGSGFSDTQIQLIWETVAEDFRPFVVNVTTDRATFDAAPVNRRTMVIFTPSNEWYGNSGGVAYLDVFGSPFHDLPCWVFTDQLLSGTSPHAPFAAEAASHEVGHTLGLNHDGKNGSTYYSGHGSGATSWGPIMGASYSPKVSHWSKGDYSGATNTEDDLAIIADPGNGLGYRADDHGDGLESASALATQGGGVLSGEGVIESRSDVDVFSFQTTGGLVSFSAFNSPTDPNLDIGLRLLDGAGAVLASSNPPSLLGASLSASVGAGTFYLEVDGVGTGDPSTAYNDYGSLGGYSLSGSAPLAVVLAGSIQSPAAAAISLKAGLGLVLDSQVSGGAPEWSLISAPPGGGVEFSSRFAASTRCEFATPGPYVIRLTVDDGAASVSEDLTVSVEEWGTAAVHPTQAPLVDLGHDRKVYSNSVVMNPSVSDDGPLAGLGYEWSVISGNASLSAVDVAGPEVQFADAEAVRLRLVVDDGQVRSYDEVTLTAQFGEQQLVAAGAPAKVFVPAGGSLGNTWRTPGFDDSGWQVGSTGAGYDSSAGAAYPIYLPLIGGGLNVQLAMDAQQAGCYLRVPFEVDSPGSVLSMVLRMNYDDGFVAYLNGVEIARGNAPAGELSWDSLAAADRPDESALTPVDFPVFLEPGMLVAGTNLLAVHGMNFRKTGGASQDRRFIILPVLDAVVTQYPYEASVAGISDPGLKGATVDADGDGRTNLQEHAAGTNPGSADEGYAMIEVPSENLVSLVMPLEPPDDVRYEVLASSDLSPLWTTVARRDGSGPWEIGIPVSTMELGDGLQSVGFAVPEGARSFFRLKITRLNP